jgi:2-keto-4-pentenoate hydratase
VPASNSPWTRNGLLDYMAAVMPAMEVVENRYGDFRSRGIGVLIADDFFHKSCVLGEPAQDWRELDLAAAGGRLLVDGAEVETGRGSDVLGHPLEAVVWLANTLAGQGKTLEAGAVVLTGSMTPLHWLEGFPCRVEAVIEGVGACALELT